MFHKNRIWTLADIQTEEELADKLVNYTWCTCNGFRLRGYLFLNDSTGPDGAQEYVVVKEESGTCIESITFGWCKYYNALKYISEALDGRYDKASYGVMAASRIDRSPNHRCYACA